MREERKNQNPELNEAALSGVSGGDSFNMVAASVCLDCPRKKTCSHRYIDLPNYLRERGYKSVGSHLRCPFNSD